MMNKDNRINILPPTTDLLAHVLKAQQQFAAALNIKQLEALFFEESRRLGFDSCIYALRVPTSFSNAQLIMLDGYPDGWVKRYFEAAYYEVDPVMTWCAKYVVPLRWSDLALEPGSRAERMMLEAAGYGLRDGVTMPVHSPQGELGVLSLSLDAPPDQARPITERALPYVQLLASHLHQAVRRISGMPQGDDSSLTARERECLSWAADGKTSSEISQLLAVCESTVNFHLNNATQKLDAVSRQHAISKAIRQRLIQTKPF